MHEVEAHRQQTRQPGGGAPATAVTEAQQFWKMPPLHRRQLALLGMWWCVMTAAYGLIGMAIKLWWEPSSAGAIEGRMQDWMAAARSDEAIRVAEGVSAMTDPDTKRAVVLVVRR
jgi:hypothetical protein